MDMKLKIYSIICVSIVSIIVTGCGESTMPTKTITNKLQVLSDFQEQQQESPSILSDSKGKVWIYALQRNPYPEDSEYISAFSLIGGEWKKSGYVTKNKGKYEAPIAACAKDGKPVVAWTEIKEEGWFINVAIGKRNGFEKPHSFPAISGKSINPVLLAASKDRTWLAWENLHERKFTIYISKYENGNWTDPIVIDKGESSCFDPALAESPDGDLFVAYGLTSGYHQNIEMSIINGNSLEIKNTVPVAMGGGLETRVNLNTKPALAFDANGRLWISYENNRNTSRFDDGDNYTGDRVCAILSYVDGEILEPEATGKWLFKGKNDHKPTFFKDKAGHLYLATHCGGNFIENPHWKYRLSWLYPQKGWSEPQTIFETEQKGVLIPPSLAFDADDNLWLTTNIEKLTKNTYEEGNDVLIRHTQLIAKTIDVPELGGEYVPPIFKESVIKEYLPDEATILGQSGHPNVSGEQITVDGEKYTLVYGNLHEHSEISSCWPAGTDGTLHDDYRFGMFTENYDFIGITDHGYAMNEVYWRKNTRLAEFYNEDKHCIALPSMEWTLRSDRNLDSIQYGAGHYNVVFQSLEDSRRFIRNQYEIYSVRSSETSNADLLWKLLHKKEINCVTIPHHPADEAHPLDWNVHDAHYATVVELFQVRGNSEYPDCPRSKNVERHTNTKYTRAFVDYALKDKKYKMGFIASGDHNCMGIGVAALWVKELTREGVIDALRNRRSFATTGDKMIIDFRVDGAIAGQTIETKAAPELFIKVKGQHELANVEILRNSKVIKEYDVVDGELVFKADFVDKAYQNEKETLYYYIRATQKNNAIAWSSPVWVE